MSPITLRLWTLNASFNLLFTIISIVNGKYFLAAIFAQACLGWSMAAISNMAPRE